MPSECQQVFEDKKEAVLLIMDSPGNLNLYNLLVIKLLRLIDGLACYLNAEFLEHVEID